MSEQIDWSKAPEGATHYVVGSIHPFEKRVGDDWFYYVGGAWARIYRKGDDRITSSALAVVPRPTTPSWSGEGLPPVGVEVLIMNPEQFAITDYGQEFVGEECTVRAAFVNDLDYRMVAVEKVGGACCCFLSEMCFPIRTHEQIAADEREAAILDIYQTICISRAQAEAIYDAGYRKP